MTQRPINSKRKDRGTRAPVPTDGGADSLESVQPDDRMLAKLAQLARFGLIAEAAPILAHADTEEG